MLLVGMGASVEDLPLSSPPPSIRMIMKLANVAPAGAWKSVLSRHCLDTWIKAIVLSESPSTVILILTSRPEKGDASMSQCQEWTLHWPDTNRIRPVSAHPVLHGWADLRQREDELGLPSDPRGVGLC